MKISVVTAVYNRVGTISDAIESVQSQTHPRIEHIIQDGGSTDGTVEVIQRLSNENTNLQTIKDSGIYDGINRGIARASGEVIGLMHSDDFFAHQHVIELVHAAFENRQVDGTYGDLQYVSSSDSNRVIRHWRSGDYEPRKLRRGWMPPHPTLYLRREVFERWGFYDTEFRISADYDAMLRYLITGGIRLKYIPEVLVKMRVGGESNRSLGHILRKSSEDLKAIRRNQVGGIGTLAMKNLSKIRQFVIKNGGAYE